MPPRTADDLMRQVQATTIVVPTPASNFRRANNEFNIALRALKAVNENRPVDYDLMNEPTAPTVIAAMDKALNTARFR